MNYPSELKMIHSDNGYHYICEFIEKATRMNTEEFANYKKILTLLKTNPRAVEDYLMILKTEGEVKQKMSENLTKTRKKEVLLSKLNHTEQKIIIELVNGTQTKDIPEKVGIAKTSLAATISTIYKKTKNIINYGKRIKMTALISYLTDECGLKPGDLNILAKSNESNSINSTMAKARKIVTKIRTNAVKVSEQSVKKALPTVPFFEYLNNTLMELRQGVHQEYLLLCQHLGVYLMENPEKDKTSYCFYHSICGFKNMITTFDKVIEEVQSYGKM